MAHINRRRVGRKVSLDFVAKWNRRWCKPGSDCDTAGVSCYRPEEEYYDVEENIQIIRTGVCEATNNP
jgi:hypothetical protein